jgi:hypothetical protein
MVMKSIEEFEERYLPAARDAKELSKMTKVEYLKWYFKTPEPYRTQVIKELIELGKAHYNEYKRIADLVE